MFFQHSLCIAMTHESAHFSDGGTEAQSSPHPACPDWTHSLGGTLWPSSLAGASCAPRPETLTCVLSFTPLNPEWKLLLVPLSRGENGGPEVGGALLMIT